MSRTQVSPPLLGVMSHLASPTCGSNALTCGALTCTTETLGGNTIAIANLIPNLTGYATLASPTFTGTLTCGALTCTSGTLGGSTIATTNLIPDLASPTFIGTLTGGTLTSGAHTSGVITFPAAMTLGTDLTAARIVLWPGAGNEWYGFGMNASTLNYNAPSGATHKFYCGNTMYATILK